MQGSVATSVVQAECCAALKASAEALGFRWQKTWTTNSESSSGVTQQRKAKQPYLPHGSEVVVAARRTRERAAGLEKGAYVCQPF